MIFGLFGWKTHPGLRYKHKNSIFAGKKVFRSIYILAKNASLQPKKGLKIFYPKFLFLFMKKMQITQFSFMKTLW